MTWLRLSEKPRAVAVANFEETGQHRLRLTIGDVVCIEQQTTNWFRGFNVNCPYTKGIFPRNCVSLREHNDRTSTEQDGGIPFLTELTTTVHEYGRLAKERFMKGDREMYELIRRTMFELVQTRRIILTGKLAEAEKRSRMLEAARKIDRCSRLLKQDLVIRDEQLGLVRADQCGMVSLYRRHVAAGAQQANGDRSINTSSSDFSSSEISDRPRDDASPNASAAFALQVSVRNLTCDLKKVGEVEASVFVADANFQPLTEHYVFKWPPPRTSPMVTDPNAQPTIVFREFGVDDTQRDSVQLVCLITSCFNEVEKPGELEYFRRAETAWKVPFACGAFDLTSVFRKSSSSSSADNAAQNGPFTATTGSLFEDADREPEHHLHLSSLEKDELFSDTLSRRKPDNSKAALVFSVRRIELNGLGSNATSKPGVTAVRSLRFADAIAVGDDEDRNDLYLFIKQGEFARGGKKADRNVEVTVNVRVPAAPPDGPSLPAFREYEVTAVSNLPPSRSHRTVAFYHHNAPRWYDILRISLPASNAALAHAHLRFTFRHRSSHVKKDKDGPFALAYFRLQSDNGTIQPDGPHKLAVHRIEGRLDETSTSYLALPSAFQSNATKLPPTAAGSNATFQASRDWLEVSTLLTSRLFTQDESLLGVLSWQRLIDKHPAELLRHIRCLALANVGAAGEASSKKTVPLTPASKRGSDLLKFLDGVLEALFGILAKTADAACLPQAERANRVEFELAVFDALVRVCLFVTQAGRSSLLDKYVEERFSFTNAHVVLTDLMAAYLGFSVSLESPSDVSTVNSGVLSTYWRHLSVQLSSQAPSGAQAVFREPLENTIKCLRPLLRFVARSRQTDEALLSMNVSQNERFESSLSSLVRLMRLFMARSSQPQSQLLKVLPDTLDVLCELQPRVAVAELFVELVDAVPARAKCMPYILFALQRVVSGAIFRFADCRAVLVPKVCSCVCENLVAELSPASVTAFRSEQVRQCADILLNALDALHSLAKEGGETQADLAKMGAALLRRLAYAVHSVDRFEKMPANPLKQALTAALLALLHQLTDAQLAALLDSDPYRELVCLHDMLLEILNVFTDLLGERPIRQSTFAADWFEMSLAQASIMQRVLVLIARKIHERFETPEIAAIEYEYQVECWYSVWWHFFETSFAFLTQRCVSIERFSAAKRDSVLSRYGDMRVAIATQIESLWFSLNQHKYRFMPQILPVFLRMTLACSSQALRRRAMHVLFDMFAFEFAQRKTLKRAEHEFITALDRLLELGLGDEQYCDVFSSEMTKLAAAAGSGNPFAHEQPDLVTMSVQLMGKLLQYRRVTTMVDETLFDVRMLAIVSLLSVYSTLRRDELYNRYVLKLAELHEACSNFVEQGFALLVLANKLDWSTQPLPNSHACLFQDEGKAAAWLKLPTPDAATTDSVAVTQRDVKFVLLTRVYECFLKGKLWERAITVLKQLVRQCELQLFNYAHLSTLLRKQAECYENIINDKMRYSPPLHYYKVGFYGKDFFPFLSNCEFIYRGESTELISTVLERIKLQFPAAEQLHGQATQVHKDSNRQYLSILPVEPQAFVTADDKLQVSEQVLEYYSMNEIHAFSTKDIMANEQRKADDVINLWMQSVEMFTIDASSTAVEGSVQLGEYVRRNAEAEMDENAELRVHLDRFPTIVRWLPVHCSRRTVLTPVQNAIFAVRSQQKQLVKAIARFREKCDKIEVQSLLRIVSGLIDAAVNGGLNKYTPFFKDEYIENPKNEEQAKYLPEFCNVIADVTGAAYSALLALGDQPALLGEMRNQFDYLIVSFQDFVANNERDFGFKLTDKERKLAVLKLRSAHSTSQLKTSVSSSQNLSMTNLLNNGSAQLSTRRPSGAALTAGVLQVAADGRASDKVGPTLQTSTVLSTSNNSLSGSAKFELDSNGSAPFSDARSGRRATVRKAINSTIQPLMTLFKGKPAAEAPNSPSSKLNESASGSSLHDADKRRSIASLDSAASSISVDDSSKISETPAEVALPSLPPPAPPAPPAVPPAPVVEKLRTSVAPSQIVTANAEQPAPAVVPRLPLRAPRPNIVNRPLPPEPPKDDTDAASGENRPQTQQPANPPPRPPRPTRGFPSGSAAN